MIVIIIIIVIGPQNYNYNYLRYTFRIKKQYTTLGQKFYIPIVLTKTDHLSKQSWVLRTGMYTVFRGESCHGGPRLSK